MKIQNTSASMQGDSIVLTTKFDPIGTNNKLQESITELMHELITANGDTTLAELGYLHMNNVSYVDGHVECKIYFDPTLATEEDDGMASKFRKNKDRMPNRKLNVFQNQLFVGELKDAVSYDTLTVPKYHIVADALDRPAIEFTGSKKVIEDSEVLVLNCNITILLAAMLDINLMDPNFNVKFETVGGTNKAKKDQPAIIMTTGAKQEFPVAITVTQTNGYDIGYEPESCINYLLSKVRNVTDTRTAQKKLAQKVSDDAKSLSKKQRESVPGYKDFRKFR